MYLIQSSDNNNTLHIQYFTLQQVRINRAGQPLTKILPRLYGGQKELAKRKNPFKEKQQEICVGSMAQTLSNWQPILRGLTVQTNKVNF